MHVSSPPASVSVPLPVSQRVEIVKLLLERPGTQVECVNLCQLYLQEDHYHFIQSDRQLQTALQVARRRST